MKERSKVLQGMTAYLAYLWKKQRAIFWMGLIFFPAYIYANYLEVYLPKMVLAELEQQRGIRHLILSMAVIMAALIVSIFFRERMSAQVEYRNRLAAQEIQKKYVSKLLYIDYGCLENPEFALLRSKAKEAIFGTGIGGAEEEGMLFDFSMACIYTVALAGNIAVYMYYLVKLSPWFLIVYLPGYLLAGIPARMIGRLEKKYSKRESEAWNKLDYVTRKTEDFTMAKDVRLYQMQDWLKGMAQKYIGERSFYKKRDLQVRGLQLVMGNALLMLENACLFAFLIYRLWQGQIDVSDFVFYAGIGGVFFFMLDDLLKYMAKVGRLSVSFGRFREYMEYGEDSGMREFSVQKQAPAITLEHVSFRYPKTESDVLTDLSLQITAGEKLAIVGVNGAGKTTLMKLICGLLHPTSGRILLNGRDIEEMEAEEVFACFSCAFQDIRFLPLPLRENISMRLAEETDDSRVWSCLEQAGMKEKVACLEQGLATRLEKNVHEDAVDFSGGERQKLVLARALYRDAGTLILDEPTAALDALAENEIYQRYAEYARGKTSFFVSHRLSSTRFCDRILLLDGGRVAEEGTHEELLARDGLYSHMFALQSKYYEQRQ